MRALHFALLAAILAVGVVIVDGHRSQTPQAWNEASLR